MHLLVYDIHLQHMLNFIGVTSDTDDMNMTCIFYISYHYMGTGSFWGPAECFIPRASSSPGC